MCSMDQLCPLDRMAGGYNPLPVGGDGKPGKPFSRIALGGRPNNWVNNPAAGDGCRRQNMGGMTGEQHMSACCEAGYKPGRDLVTALMSPQQLYEQAANDKLEREVGPLCCYYEHGERSKGNACHDTPFLRLADRRRPDGYGGRGEPVQSIRFSKERCAACKAQTLSREQCKVGTKWSGPTGSKAAAALQVKADEDKAAAAAAAAALQVKAAETKAEADKAAAATKRQEEVAAKALAERKQRAEPLWIKASSDTSALPSAMKPFKDLFVSGIDLVHSDLSKVLSALDKLKKTKEREGGGSVSVRHRRAVYTY